MTAMTCSRVTPAFTVRMTITPVVVGEVACAWARAGWVMEVAPIRVRVSAKAMLRIAFIGLASPITAVIFVLLDNHYISGVGARHQRGFLFSNQMLCRFPRGTIRDYFDGV